MKKTLVVRSVGLASAAALACGVIAASAAFAAGSVKMETASPSPSASASSTASASPSASSSVSASASASTTTPKQATYRLAGYDRYETAVAISKQFYPTSKSDRPKTVYIASGMNFPDALSAAPVAALDKAPLLLVNSTAIPKVVADEIERLQPQRIVVVGGAGAVNAAVVEKLQELRPNGIVRIGGADRYETSRKVAEYAMNDAIGKPLFSGKIALVATGADFPDALSAGAVAGLKEVKAPVILEDGNALAMSTAGLALLKKLGTPEVTVIGGNGAVRNELMNSIPSENKVTRAGGKDRYATSQAVVDKFVKESEAPASTVGFLATGLNYPDALAGAAYAGASGSPLWVVPSTCVPVPVFTTANKLGLERFDLIGGVGALTASVDQLTACAQ